MQQQGSGEDSGQGRPAMADTTSRLIALLGDTLSLAPQITHGLNRETALFGNLPELDSMAVATVLTAIEDEFDILIDDDDISGELFESIGSLADFIDARLAA